MIARRDGRRGPARGAVIAALFVALLCVGAATSFAALLGSQRPAHDCALQGDRLNASCFTTGAMMSRDVVDRVLRRKFAAATAASTSCSPGFAECFGACVDTLSNPSNCGQCGQACPAGQICTAGACATGSGSPTAMNVTPSSSFSATGVQGGPFTPNSVTYTIAAPTGSVNWAIAAVPNWLTPSAYRGVADANGAEVVFTVNANANSAGVGQLNDEIEFYNETGGTGGATMSAQLNVLAPLSLVSTASAQAEVGASYLQTNVASGGTKPYSYAVSAGALPAGVALDASTGTASGTPTAAGAFNYTITATDSGAPVQTAPQVVSGTILPAATTTTLTAAPNPSTSGDTVTLTAGVTSNAGAPSGQVTFKDGATALGSAALSFGTATFNASGLAAGSHKLTAAYGGGANFAASVSATVTESVDAAAPVYQGAAFVIAASGGTTGACASNGVKAGDAYTILYRPAAQSGSEVYGGGIGLASDLASESLDLAAGVDLPAGRETRTVIAHGQSSAVGPFSTSSTFDLEIGPDPLPAKALWATIAGTVTNMWGFGGCTVTLRAALALRP